ncbi:MAG: tyrosine--tRNA ligase [Chloroflexi bacterium]|nr:tyrosine--tRNA ligase [Chloroflexota bacterium]
MARVTDQATRTVIDEFRWRGLIHVTEDGQELYTPGLEELLAQEKITAYIGFDPSADSLHVGNLLVIMMLVRMQQHGHTPIAIAGGGTGLIGDPGGKTQERQLLTREILEANLEGIKAQLSRFLDFNAQDNAALLINNADWLDQIKTIDFMRDVGKHFSINYMLAKDSVQSRLGDGITYTEFSYMLLQAYDYMKLYDTHGCVLQMGGSDQWGNITAGIDLIRRARGGQAHALVTPLITNASGTKFGKSEAGAVWLDAEKTSPFQFYQFWMNTADADAVRFLKYFTLMAQGEIAEFDDAVASRPEKRETQQRLAVELTRMTHGETGLQRAYEATRIMFDNKLSDLDAKQLLDIFQDVPSLSLPKERLEGDGISLLELVVLTELASSRAEARRLVQGGGISLRNQRVSDVRYMVTLEDSVEGKVLVLWRGAREYRLVRLEG